VLRRQSLYRADPRDHLVLECQPLESDLLDYPQRAVVERRIAPDKKGATFSFRELLHEEAFIVRFRPGVPFIDAGAVVGTGISSLRGFNVDRPITCILDEALADVLSELPQGGLLRTLVGDKEHVDLVQGINRLNGDIIRISGADADDQDLAHSSLEMRVAGAAALLHAVADMSGGSSSLKAVVKVIVNQCPLGVCDGAF